MSFIEKGTQIVLLVTVLVGQSRKEHLVTLLRYNTGATFKSPQPILFRGILAFVICLSTVTTYDVIIFSICIIQKLTCLSLGRTN